MSIQTILRNAAQEYFPDMDRNDPLGFAVGFYFGLEAANNANNATGNCDEIYQSTVKGNVEQGVSILNETVLFNFRLAMSVAAHTFKCIHGFKTNPVKINVSHQGPIGCMLLNTKDFFTDDELAIFSQHQSAILNVVKVLQENTLPITL